MTAQNVLVSLRDLLAELYETESSARRIAMDVGLNISRIEFSANAIDCWHSILKEAKKAHKLTDLLDVVQGQYEKNPELQRLRTAYDEQGKIEARITGIQRNRRIIDRLPAAIIGLTTLFILLLIIIINIESLGRMLSVRSPSQNPDQQIPVVDTDRISPTISDVISSAFQSDEPFISNIWTASGKGYKLETCGKGALYYIDRDYKIISTSHPEYDGLPCIKTSNDSNDKESDVADFLKFKLHRPVTIYLYFDRRMEHPPDWVDGLFHEIENVKIYVDEPDMDYFQVYGCQSAAGEIILGGAKYGGELGGKSMYVVAFREGGNERPCDTAQSSQTATTTLTPTDSMSTDNTVNTVIATPTVITLMRTRQIVPTVNNAVVETKPLVPPVSAN